MTIQNSRYVNRSTKYLLAVIAFTCPPMRSALTSFAAVRNSVREKLGVLVTMVGAVEITASVRLDLATAASERLRALVITS